MESTYHFQVSYNRTHVCTISAHSGFEAIDRAFYRYVEKHPNISRKLFKAKKV
jgi:hypothetical protein